MNPLNPLFALLPVAAALATSLVIVWRFGAPPKQGRFATIDGLRGYLAFFVFVHHAAVWYYYLHGVEWRDPPSHLYTNFGQVAVALFFMITGFLFFSKIIDARVKNLDWTRLYVSRVLRLVPLYLLAMGVLFTICADVSGWRFHQSVATVVSEAARWLSFTAFGDPGINGVRNTSVIIADVVWTLPYEWIFYLLLPLIALAVGVRAPWRYLVPSALIGLALAGVLIARHSSVFHWLSFGGGIAAALAVRSERFRRIAGSRWNGALSLLLIATVLAVFPTTHAYVPLLLLSIAFVMIASGNSLFGILSSGVSRSLGEQTYSIYLLHGLGLFIFFRFVVGMERISNFGPMAYWTIITAVTPALIITCYFTFRFVEHPAMHSAESVTRWLRRRSPGTVRPASVQP